VIGWTLTTRVGLDGPVDLGGPGRAGGPAPAAGTADVGPPHVQWPTSGPTSALFAPL